MTTQTCQAVIQLQGDVLMPPFCLQLQYTTCIGGAPRCTASEWLGKTVVLEDAITLGRVGKWHQYSFRRIFGAGGLDSRGVEKVANTAARQAGTI
jgi:hypothetical protein